MISAVADLAGRLKNLGISLGVRASDLDTILSDNPHSSSDCLREVLTLWLRQRYNVCTTLIYLVLKFWSVHWAMILLDLLDLNSVNLPRMVNQSGWKGYGSDLPCRLMSLMLTKIATHLVTKVQYILLLCMSSGLMCSICCVNSVALGTHMSSCTLLLADLS